MKVASAYMNSQVLTLDGEQAFAELYARLARWSDEIIALQRRGDTATADGLIERSMTLLTYMDRQIDISGNYDIATQILRLHRFAIRTLVNTKLTPDGNQLDGLAHVFIALGEIFTAMRSPKAAVPSSTN